MIKGNDVEFSKLQEFSSIQWIAYNMDDIYIPDYNDVLRVAFTSKFKRGRLSELVSLLSGRDFETRDYKEEIAFDSYNKLHDGVMKFVNKTNFERFMMIIKSTGIIDKSMIRSDNVLNFGYALYLFLKDKKINSNIIEKVVRKWIVLSVLTGRYSGSPESIFDYDIKRFDINDPLDYLRSVELGELSDAYWNHILPTRLNTSVASSPFFKLYLMAQVKANDKGFLSTDITVQTMIEDRGDIHHLFPKKYLQNNGIKNRADYNQIANYVYTQQEINIKIKDAVPNIYMKEVANQIDTKKPLLGGIVDQKELDRTLKENCIPKEFINYDINNYNEFLEQRRQLISQKIKEFYFNL